MSRSAVLSLPVSVLRATALCAVLALSGPAVSLAAYNPPSHNVAWQPAAADADIDKAFAQGKAEKKPVLVYWGAAWCPPCNQLKATLFNRQDFAERSKSFVAVHIDGDAPGAQKLGSRFKVRGYPTVILFNPEGQEITRLPGEVDAPQVMNVLQMGLSGGRPIKAVLADARAGKPLPANEWRLLAFYSWDTDEAQLVPAAERPGLLAQLAAAAPAAEVETSTRLLLKSLAETDAGKPAAVSAAQRERVLKVVADAAASRTQMDVIVNYAPDLVSALAPQAGPDRKSTAAAVDTALQRLQADTTLSRSDRLSALIARVGVARLDQPKDTLKPQLPDALVKQVRDMAATLDREITDGYERQAVITSAAYALGQAGLWKESDALLKANLAKSHSPYYLMSQLGGNAKKQGRKDDALAWYAQAFAKSEGPATRLQWGSSYFTALIELSPKDAATIEKVAAQLFTEAGNQQGAFYERSARSLQKVGTQLGQWNKGGQHQAVVDRLKAQLAPVCGKLPVADGQKATCDGLIKA
ncbi:thioredoxin family protein [Ideonella margarita]|uniref:Thioredoxin fold domain-containing protein n=1 Tax=Ideonella margarita TaxID=2984191 RepID=A0ABU9C4F2_9BURK